MLIAVIPAVNGIIAALCSRDVDFHRAFGFYVSPKNYYLRKKNEGGHESKNRKGDNNILLFYCSLWFPGLPSVCLVLLVLLLFCQSSRKFSTPNHKTRFFQLIFFASKYTPRHHLLLLHSKSNRPPNCTTQTPSAPFFLLCALKSPSCFARLRYCCNSRRSFCIYDASLSQTCPKTTERVVLRNVPLA